MATAATTLSGQISALATAVGTECKAIRTLIGSLDGLSTSTKTSLVAAVNELKSKADSLSTSLNSLTTRVGTAETNISTNTGDITSAKSAISSLQSSVSSMQSDISNLQTAVALATEIDDAKTGTDTTWSSSKITSSITSAKQEVKDDILGGAGTAYDTLKELADLITTNKSAIEALQSLSAGHVKFDAAQTLTSTQQAQARSNIGAASASDLSSLTSRVSTAEGKISTNTTNISTLTTNVGDTAADFVAVFEAALA